MANRFYRNHYDHSRNEREVVLERVDDKDDQYDDNPVITSRPCVPKRSISDFFASATIAMLLISILVIFITLLCLGGKSTLSHHEKITLASLENVCTAAAQVTSEGTENLAECERACLEARKVCEPTSLRRHLDNHGADETDDKDKELCDHFKDVCTVLDVFENPSSSSSTTTTKIQSNETEQASDEISSSTEDNQSKIELPPTTLALVCSQSSIDTVEGFEECKVACSTAFCCSNNLKEFLRCYEDNSDACDAYQIECEKIWTIATTDTSSTNENYSSEEEDETSSDPKEENETEEESVIQRKCHPEETNTPEGLDECRSLCTGHMCCVMDRKYCQCADPNQDCTLYESCYNILLHNTWLPLLDGDCLWVSDEEK